MTTDSKKELNTQTGSTKTAVPVGGKKSSFSNFSIALWLFVVWVYYRFFKSIFAFRDEAHAINIQVRSSSDLFYIAILALVNLVSILLLRFKRTLTLLGA